MSIESSVLRFSGHQTFPLRYGWIHKAIDAYYAQPVRPSVEDQMVKMGVGKNMVLSMHYWMKSLGLVDEKDALTPIAKLLFGSSLFGSSKAGLDPYMDRIGTIWLLHWLGQSIDSNGAHLNASRWFFNYSTGVSFDKIQLCDEIAKSLNMHNKALSISTLKKDIDCLFASYSVRNSTERGFNEDSLMSPFVELELIVQLDSKVYLAELSSRSSLPDEIFTYALIDYIKRRMCSDAGANTTGTLAFTELLGGIGAPGRVFRLSSDGLSNKLDAVQSLTNGFISWTDTQGLRQIQFNRQEIKSSTADKLLKNYYSD